MTVILGCALVLAACNHLSDEAKEIAGNYYISEISQDEPLMELNKNGKCKIRAINPGVLTMTVEGKWNVEGNKLILDLDPSTLRTEGDSTLVGKIVGHQEKPIVDFNGITLTVNDHGSNFMYHRRNDVK